MVIFMPKLKIAVVGPGLIGKQHIRLVHENTNSELISIVAPNTGINTKIAIENKVPIFYSIEECLKNCQPDGVIISSPNPFHAEQARYCIEAGVAVLIEKPLTASVAEGRSLVRLAQEKKAKVLVGHHRAHSPLMETARNVIRSGRIGRVVSIIGSAQFYKPASYFAAGPWRTQIGGGPILINLIHEIGNLRSLVGEITAVQAITSSSIRNFNVEDTAVMNFIFENGALGTFVLSDTAASAKSWEQTSGENSTYPMYVDEDCYSIAGTHGSLSIPSMRLKFYPEGTPPSWWTPFDEQVVKVDRQNPLQLQFAHFLDVIRGKSLPLVSVADGFRNLLITDAIQESAVKKSLVMIQE